MNASITAWPSLVKPMMGLGSVPAPVVASLPHTKSTAIEGEGTSRVIDETGLNEPSHGPYALGTRARASFIEHGQRPFSVGFIEAKDVQASVTASNLM